MKKIVMAAGAALLTLSFVGCKDVVCKSGSCGNMSFEDSVTCYSGELMGAMFRQHIDNPAASVDFDKAEIARGIRDVMKTDTANISYIIGLQMGMSAFQTYQGLSKDVEMNRGDYVAAIMSQLNADSVANIEALRATVMSLQTQIEERQRIHQEEEAYNSDAALANRQEQDSAFAALKNDAKYQALADGIYCEVIKPGDGTKLTDNQRVMVEYQIDNLKGEKAFGNLNNPRQMTVGRASNEVINKLLPYMELGQTARFYLPWEQAFGKLGMPQSSIGPCQAVVVTLITTPAESK